MLAPASSAHAQAPNLGAADTFAVLGGSTVTNTGPTVIGGTASRPGNVGVSPAAQLSVFHPAF